MRIDIMTLFPEMCEAFLSESIIGRARAAGHVDIRCVNIRDYYPYGGGTGMVMQPNPIYDCYQAVTEEGARKCHLIYMTPQGKTLTQERVRELSEMDDLVFLCGHYEGVDERVIEEIVDEEISIGDYVLTGGELPALILADSISRMLPGVLAHGKVDRWRLEQAVARTYERRPDMLEAAEASGDLTKEEQEILDSLRSV